MAWSERFAGDADNLYVGVYDGHGGRGAVDFVVAHAHVRANEWTAARGADAQKASQAGRSRAIDKMLAQAGARGVRHDGERRRRLAVRCPARHARTLLAANVGDSRTLVLAPATRRPCGCRRSTCPPTPPRSSASTRPAAT